MNLDFLRSYLPHAPMGSIAVYLSLVTRPVDLQGVSLTFEELERGTGLGQQAVMRSLLWLGEPIDVLGKSVGDALVVYETPTRLYLPKEHIGEGVDKYFNLTKEEGPARLAEYEETIACLRRQLDERISGDYSDLGHQLPDDLGKAVRSIEYVLGRGMTAKEVFYLGQMFLAFGPENVLRELKKNQKTRDPLRATYAKLNNYSKGKAVANKKVEVPPEVPVSYWSPEGNLWT